MKEFELEIKLNFWESKPVNQGRVSIVHGKISREQLERIIAIVHETERKNG